VSDAPRAQHGAFRQLKFLFHPVPIHPCYKAGLSRHIPVTAAGGLVIAWRAVHCIINYNFFWRGNHEEDYERIAKAKGHW
jgi:hypothetical protein